jgi:hypothetical protein
VKPPTLRAQKRGAPFLPFTYVQDLRRQGKQGEECQSTQEKNDPPFARTKSAKGRAPSSSFDFAEREHGILRHHKTEEPPFARKSSALRMGHPRPTIDIAGTEPIEKNGDKTPTRNFLSCLKRTFV